MQFTSKRTRTIALRNVSLEIEQGQFVAIVGPSGCGKTTLLSLAAGLTSPSRGVVTSNGSVIKGINTNVGYVTQRDTVLPWRNVEANIALALEIRGYAKADREVAVRDAINLVGLAGFEGHYPHQLSGGMLKRVLLARTLVYEPPVLLLDEPFAALDAQLRLGLHAELMRIWAAKGFTVVLVTHDLDEAVTLADRIVILKGSPAHVEWIEDVKLPRPRDPIAIRFDPLFTQTVQTLWQRMLGTAAGGDGIDARLS